MNTRVEHTAFDSRYLSAEDRDPWSYASSPYERQKYRRTLGALPSRRFARALEAGCSIGVFTTLLAERCDELVAVDFSEPALAEARRRTAGLAGVEVLRRDLPAEMPAGPFDLIVFSEVLYYWSSELVLDALRRSETALRPAGSLLVVNWRGEDREAPLDGDGVHALIATETTLRHAHSEAHAAYLIDRWDGDE